MVPPWPIFSSRHLLLALFLACIIYSQVITLKKDMLSPIPKINESQTNFDKKVDITDTNMHGTTCYIFFSVTGGFANQFKGFRKASHLASLSNCTLIIPPLLDHHAFAFGGWSSCKFGHETFKTANSAFLNLLPNYTKTNSASIYDAFEFNDNLKQSETIPYVDLQLRFPQCTFNPHEFPLLGVDCDTTLESMISMIVPTSTHMPCPVINNLPNVFYLKNLPVAKNVIANIASTGQQFVKATRDMLLSKSKRQLHCIFLRCTDGNDQQWLDSPMLQYSREFVTQKIVHEIQSNTSFFLMSRCHHTYLQAMFAGTPFQYNHEQDTTCDQFRHPLLRGECLPSSIKSANIGINKINISKSMQSFLNLFDDLSLCASAEKIFSLNLKSIITHGKSRLAKVKYSSPTGTSSVPIPMSTLGKLVREVAQAIPR